MVSGLQNAQQLIDRIRAGDAPYDLIEVMACPGGCINGSGNPAPQLTSDTEERLEVLYRLDREAPIRTSQDNPSVQAVYSNWLGEPDSETSHHALHTTYGRRSMRLEETSVEESLKEEPVIDVGVCIGTNCYVKGSWQLLEGLAAELAAARPVGALPGQGPVLYRPVREADRISLSAKGSSVFVDPADAAAIIDGHLMPLLDAMKRAKG